MAVACKLIQFALLVRNFMSRDAYIPRDSSGEYKRIAEFIQHYYANYASII